jgi:hypothetical protein
MVVGGNDGVPRHAAGQRAYHVAPDRAAPVNAPAHPEQRDACRQDAAGDMDGTDGADAMPPVRLTPLRLISAALLSVTTTLHALQLPVRQYCPCYRTTGIRQPSRSMTSPHSTVRHRRTRAAHCWRTSDRNALPDGIERTARGACGVCLPNSCYQERAHRCARFSSCPEGSR